MTGGIGCGKSTVARILEDLGLRRLDTDEVARELVAPGSSGLKRVVEVFGESILLSDGGLDRASLGQRVFSSDDERKKLEAILHPLIWSRVASFLSDCRQSEADSLVEVPLLFENARQDEFGEVWVVSCQEELQRERLRKRNGWSDLEIDQRLASQMPLAEKVARADVVIDNSFGLAELKQTLIRQIGERQGRLG